MDANQAQDVSSKYHCARWELEDSEKYARGKIWSAKKVFRDFQEAF